MSKKKKKPLGISRREFLKDAGIIAGGAAIGSTVLLAACKGAETTKTVTTTLPGATQTVTTTTTQQVGTATVTTTLPGQTQTVTTTATVTGPGATVEGLVALTVNGKTTQLVVQPEWSLAFVLREKLGLTGTKIGCDRGECGSCTIIADGRAVFACTIMAIEAGGMNIRTVEGLANGSTLHPIQKLFLDNNAFQCGYCTPGVIMSSVALLEKTPSPTMDQAREALSGNLCMCGDYTRWVNTVLKGGQ